MGVTVRPVAGRHDLTSFIKLPFRLRKDDPQWVPPLIFERRQFLDRYKNPYFDHAEAEYFLAERDGAVVGRITAQVDHRWDEYQGGERRDVRVLRVRGRPRDRHGRWSRRRATGCASAAARDCVGPMDFTTNDECGLLIEGFDEPSMILEPWHPPYYRELLEGLGLTKTMDLLMWELWLGTLTEGDQFHEFIEQAAEKSRDGARRRRPPDAKARPRGRDRRASWRSTTRPGAATGGSSRSPRTRSPSRRRT